MARGIFLTVECDALCVIWGEFAGSCQLLLWDGLGSSEQLHCATLLGRFSLLSPLSSIFIACSCCILFIKKSLSCFYLNPLVLPFSDSPPQPTGAGVSEGLSSNYQFLNHNNLYIPILSSTSQPFLLTPHQGTSGLSLV